MGKTKRAVITDKRKDHTIHPHERPVRCENCGELFPPEEVLIDRDEQGRILGRFCEGCI